MDAIDFKFFPDTNLLLQEHCFEEILNQNKLDGMVSNHLRILNNCYSQ